MAVAVRRRWGVHALPGDLSCKDQLNDLNVEDLATAGWYWGDHSDQLSPILPLPVAAAAAHAELLLRRALPGTEIALKDSFWDWNHVKVTCKYTTWSRCKMKSKRWNCRPLQEAGSWPANPERFKRRDEIQFNLSVGWRSKQLLVNIEYGMLMNIIESYGPATDSNCVPAKLLGSAL